MEHLDNVISKARDYALEQIHEYWLPDPFNLDLSYKKWIEIATNVWADVNIVRLGTLFMDIALWYCFREKILSQHIELWHSLWLKFAEEYNIDSDITASVWNCILEHHGDRGFSSLESEVVANADCYRFASVQWVLRYIQNVGKHHDVPFEDLIKQVKSKYEEKKWLLSLPLCKEELKGWIEAFDVIFKEFFN
jgi:hypothetical protein